ncbi:hypothetical protein D3C87_1919110 [compost metagenome]
MNWPAVQQQLVFTGLDAGRQPARERIVFQQMRQGFAVGQIIDRHNFKVAAT